MDHVLGEPHLFSTPDKRGSLGTDGSWALYFVHKIGVLCFGQYWPIAGWTTLVILVTLLVTALAWSFRTCERCLCCGGSCCRRSQRPTGGTLDPALRHLPETPVPPAYSSVALVGPGCSTPVDTEYYQRKVRGRGPDGEHTTWFFNSPTERCDYSLIGPREPGLIGTACGSSPVASLASPPAAYVKLSSAPNRFICAVRKTACKRVSSTAKPMPPLMRMK